MMKHEFYYTSRDSVTKIHAIEWLPDRDIKGVLQICHGMVEYIDRYDEFAEFMSEHGYYVVGRFKKCIRNTWDIPSYIIR